MPLGNPEAAIGFAAEFQSSGLPWVTASVATPGTVQRWNLPKVSRSLLFRNLTASTFLVVAFTQNGAGGSNRYLIPGGASEVFETRVKEVYVTAVSGSCDYSMFAALTTVPPKYMPQLTGSITGSQMWDGVG